MNFSCPACQAKYFVQDEDVLGRTFKLSCRKCRGDIPIQGRRKSDPAPGPARTISSDRLRLSLPLELSAARATAEVSESPAPASVRPSVPPPLLAKQTTQYYVAVRGAPVGPFEADEVARRAERGDIGPRTYIWSPGQQAWQRLAKVPEFSHLLIRLSVPPAVLEPALLEPAVLEPAVLEPAMLESGVDPLARTPEERLGFGYLGKDTGPGRSFPFPRGKHVRLSQRPRRSNPPKEWASLFVGLVISLAVGVALGSML